MTRLIEQLARLPGIGEKTAARLAFYILRADRQYAQALAEAVLAVKDETRLCSVCFALTEADPCPICTDPARLADAICVVEEPADLLAVERAWEFRGRYHVLHGALAPSTGWGPTSSRSSRSSSACATARCASDPRHQPTAEGEATALYLARPHQAPRHPRDPHRARHPGRGRPRVRRRGHGRPRPRGPPRDVRGRRREAPHGEHWTGPRMREIDPVGRLEALSALGLPTHRGPVQCSPCGASRRRPLTSRGGPRGARPTVTTSTYSRSPRPGCRARCGSRGCRGA